MSKTMSKGGFAKLKQIKRKSISLSEQSLIETELYESGPPLIMRPGSDALDAIAWAAAHREDIEKQLLRHGGVLLRGFDIPDIDAFQKLARAIAPDLLDYVERAAPRQELAAKVFTSTEYPSAEWIPLHHEMSYSHNWPTKLFFYCDIPPGEGGYTPFTNDRRIFDLIRPEIKQAFMDKKVMYVRNYGEGVDMPWQEVFQTEDRAEVEAYLTKSKTRFTWFPGDRLRTYSVRQAVATHPVTGDTVWFNHAHLFHISNMPDAVREALLEEFEEEELPRNALFGDGSKIPEDWPAELRALYRENAILFPWQKGDVLILDNFLTSHGRSPFKGDRRICVAMAELYTNPEFR